MMALEHRIARGAAALSIPVDEYRAEIEAGNRWCYGCRRWHHHTAFGERRSRPDGLDNECREHRNARARQAMRRLSARRREAAA